METITLFSQWGWCKYMKDLKKKRHVKKINEIYNLAGYICKKHKECDWQNVFHTLQCLKQTAIERLEMSIRRANLSFYSKRD